MSAVVQQLRGTLLPERAGLTDGQLLERFVRRREPAAAAALVQRHGPMVLGVCRRVLGNVHDAEDAFQATFLVLVRKAASIRGDVGSWLHGVARRTALNARASRAKRRERERSVLALPEPAVADQPGGRDLQPLLDREVSRLPEKYRTVLVLCGLGGQTGREAARQLGLPHGTVASRLARARALLAKRLARHGLALSGGALAAGLWPGATSACVPPPVASSTIQAVTSVTAGQAAPGLISAQAAALTEGVLRSMLLTKLKGVLAVLLVLGLGALSAGALISRSRATEPAGGPAGGQAQARANRDDLHARVVELKRQLQQLQRQVAGLEQETLPRPAEGGRPDAFVASRFKYRVPFETGYTETKGGGRIEIREVWGTRPRIEVGGQYLVRGRYVLPPGERGTLYFYETATGDWSQPTATMDLQTTRLQQGQGSFTLLHGMAGPGYFHLVLASPERYSRPFANVYFGTGDNVLRKKP
jgi:RNA polymerase sigma factor (sigma-70 family)